MLLLIGSVVVTAYLLFSNYQQARLFTQAKREFLRGSAESLALAKVQLLQVIGNDDDNEAAYGFRDREYFKLKIYQLPEISSEKSI